MKQQTKQTRKNPVLPVEQGFDYVLPPRAIGVGAVDFTGLLTDAKIFAVAFGVCIHSALGITVPVVTLVGKEMDPLREAFQEPNGLIGGMNFHHQDLAPHFVH